MAFVSVTTESPLVLVRHGESTWNALRLVQGQDDRATLTPFLELSALAAQPSTGHFDPDVYRILMRYFSKHPNLDWRSVSPVSACP